MSPQNTNAPTDAELDEYLMTHEMAEDEARKVAETAQAYLSAQGLALPTDLDGFLHCFHRYVLGDEQAILRYPPVKRTVRVVFDAAGVVAAMEVKP